MPRDGKRYPLNMRTTKEIRERLEAAAAASGRSMAQEVERRLENSFLEKDKNDLERRVSLLERILLERLAHG